jgi:aromatic ring-opening dioxygenase LigB subunit
MIKIVDWTDNLKHRQDTGPDDLVFVSPHEVHMEENLGLGNEAVCQPSRNGIEGIVGNAPDRQER